MNTFEKFIIAHLIADFLLQNNWMALNKTKRVLPLLVHLFIYGVCMLLFLPQSLSVVVGIVVLHGAIDRLSLADKWLWLIRGRSFKSIWDKNKDKNKDNVYISFTCIVYVVVDFLIHFIVTWPLIYNL